jgi:hypothetical protein
MLIPHGEVGNKGYLSGTRCRILISLFSMKTSYLRDSTCRVGLQSYTDDAKDLQRLTLCQSGLEAQAA